MFTGTIPARHAIYLAEHLVLNPMSRVFAIRGGAPELQGWDQATIIAARTHNLIAALLMGFSKGANDPAMFVQYPGERSDTTTAAYQPATLAELSTTGFEKFMYG